MNSKAAIILLVIICITLLGLIGHRLMPSTGTKKQTAFLQEMEEPDAEDKWEKRESRVAHQGTTHLKTKKDTESGDTENKTARSKIDFWETRILDFAKSFVPEDVDENDVHELAKKTADLFQMLQTASTRREKGKEPYTGRTGFATMTLVMAMDKEFHEVLGVTFSDFMGTLDTSLIKKRAEPE
jgi:hypothetical protein